MRLATQSARVALATIAVSLSAWGQGIDYAKIEILTEKIAPNLYMLSGSAGADPGHEDAVAIAEQIAAGARSAGAREGDRFSVDLDRHAAIRLAFERAQPGDAVLLAGKGHEQRMVVGDERRGWNDARAAADVLTDLGFQIQAVP